MCKAKAKKSAFVRVHVDACGRDPRRRVSFELFIADMQIPRGWTAFGNLAGTYYLHKIPFGTLSSTPDRKSNIERLDHAWEGRLEKPNEAPNK